LNQVIGSNNALKGN